MDWNRATIREHIESRIKDLKAKLTSDYSVSFIGECCDACKDHLEASLFCGFWKAKVVRTKDNKAFNILLVDPDRQREERNFTLSLLQQE